MAITIATPVTFSFNVIGDGSSTVVAIDLGAEPFNLALPIQRVTVLSLVVLLGAVVTATRAFVGTVLTLTFSAPPGLVSVNVTVLV
jgi:hypothetical protein